MALDLETIGIAFDTSGLEKGARALNDTEKAAHGAADAADKVGRSGRSFGTFGSDASKAADALGLYASSAKNAIDHQKELMRILDRANPAAAAARQLADEVQTLNRALRDGTIGQETYRSAMRNVFDEANRASGAISNMGSAAGALHGIFAKLGGVFAAGFSAREFLATADAVTSLNNQLKLATGSADSAKTAYTALFEIAQRSRVSFVELGTTYASIARSTGEMGISQQRLLKVTESIGNAMTISGGSAQGMQAALVQLSQGFASGTLRGDELNSVMEQTPRLAKAIAEGMGISVGKLREMGKEGQLTSEAVVKALESQSDVLRKEVAGATLTVGQAFTQLGNASTRAIGEFDAATGASSAFATAISEIASAMNGLGASFKENQTTINTVMGALGGTAAVAALRLLPGAIGAVGTAITGLAAILAANPVTLTLLGIGAAVGGAVAYGRAEARTAEGIQRSIAALQAENQRSEEAMRRATEGGRSAGADTIRKTIDERTAAITKLREELLKLQSSSSIGAGPGRGTISPPTVAEMEKQQNAAAVARSKAINDLLGVNQKYQEKLTELQGLEKSGALTHEEYTQAVSKLATATYNATDAGKAAAEASKAGAKARDEAAKAAEREAHSYTGFVNSIREKIAAQELELAGGDKLSQSQKVRLQLEKMIANGKLASSRASSEELKTDLDRLKANELEIAGRKAAIDAVNSQRAAYIALSNEAATQNKSIESGNTSLREQIATMGLTNQQIRARTIELNRATIAEKEQQLARLQTGYTNTREQAALEEEIRLLKERNGLLSDQGVKEQYVAAQQEITDTWVSIDRTAHDTFVNIFEDGAGTFKRLGQTLKAALLDMLYQMTVKRWIINIGASMGATGGIFAAGSAMAGQGGSGGVGNLAGSALNMAGGSIFGAGGLSGALMGGAGWLTGSTTFGGALGAAGSLIGTGTAGGIASGLAMGAGALAPIALGVGLLGSALGLFRSLERKGGGLTGTLGKAGGVHDVDLMRRGGSLFSGPDWFTNDKGVSALDRAIQQQFDLSKTAIKGFAETLGLASDKVDGFTTTLGTQTMGDHGQLGIRLDKDGKPLSDQEIQTAIAEAIKSGSNELAQQLIGTWTESVEQVTRTVVNTTLGNGDGWDVSQVTEDVTRRSYTPSEFARDGEQAIDTLTRLATSLQGVNAMFDTLGLTLYEASLKGGDMASQLADAAGGLDKLQASSASYFQNFYTGSEQHATALRQLQEQMQRMGVETIPYTREQFRALVESLDLTTEAGRQMYAGLLGISEAFATVTPQLFQAGQTLSDAITQGLLGTYDGADLGAYMAQTVQDGIYNAVAGQFSAQITDIITAGVINPVIQAAITGSSVSAAVSQASIDAMVAQANAVAAAAAAVLNDPAFQEAMASIGKAVGSISLPAQHVAPSISTYTRAVEDSGTAASRAADQISDAWKSIGDTLMDEVNRIRGVLNESAGQGVDYWQAQLAIAKAQAMAGDQDAARSLAGISQNLLRAGEESAGSMLELQRLRAQVAQSLQGVAGYAYGLAGIGVQQPTATPPVWTGTTSDGSPYAKPYSPPHTGPGAITNAPIESMAWVAPPTYSAPSDSSNADVVAELRALRQAIETADRTDADLQRRTVRVLERFDTLGMPPERVEA